VLTLTINCIVLVRATHVLDVCCMSSVINCIVLVRATHVLDVCFMSSVTCMHPSPL
jgi:hypothetical protein